MKSLITILVLVSLLVQTVFGGLQDNVVICLGGGHDHADPVAQTTAPACCEGCSHDDQWPAPAVADEHNGDCGCTDIELALIDLLAMPRLTNRDVAVVMTPPAPSTTATPFDALPSTWRGPPLDCIDTSSLREHDAAHLRIAIVRTTRLLI